MLTSDFDYDLPPNRIAAYPAPRRDASRLMTLDRRTGAVKHRVFSDLPDLLREGDCLVLNDSRVIPARLAGRLKTGGRAEALLIRSAKGGGWISLVRPARRLPTGASFEIGGDERGRAIVRVEAEGEGGERVVRIESAALTEFEIIERFGSMPLPPYIVAARRKSAEDAGRGAAWSDREDRERYQTVYAREMGSVAAPTAGLHFTPEILAKLEAGGIEVRRVTLHVGPGTFAPVKTREPKSHPMHSEIFSVDAENAQAIERAVRDAERRVIAVGTTATRALETLMSRKGRIEAATAAATDLMILPGFEFRAVDALITNFHLPRSTLLMLVSAFAGRESILKAYREAIERDYRFYSYGDAMFIA